MNEHRSIDNIEKEVEDWIDKFNTATTEQLSAEGCRICLDELFHDDSFWRDALSLTGKLETKAGKSEILQILPETLLKNKVSDLALDPKSTKPSIVNRAGKDVIEAFFTFSTKIAHCRGIVRFLRNANAKNCLEAWTFFTAIETLIGYEEKVDKNRPTGQSYSRDFRGPNWLDNRIQSASYKKHDPSALVIGGGQAGLSIAARLTQLGVDTLIVEKNSRIGDNWRNRYHALTLHNQLHVNHLPYMPFPPTWPTYIPKDMLALWFEAYAAAMELNFWTGYEVIAAKYDKKSQRWEVELKSFEGIKRKVFPRHVIMATGVSGIPNIPNIETLSTFKGPIIHSSQYDDGDNLSGTHAIVVGSGNSGHDISQDLYSSGAKVTMIQRSPSLVVNIEPSAQFPYKLYDEERNIDECDLITSSMPIPLVKEAHRYFTKAARDNDKSLLDGLEKIGFKLDFGDDDTGWQFKYLSRGGGYYFNVGCSNLLVEGKIGLVQYDHINRFTKNGMKLLNGSEVEADTIILATGYKPQEFLVSKIFGNEVAKTVGPIWGFGDGFELRNMYCRTKQPGLWFIAGSFAQCRINSKYLALQVKAFEEGLF